MSDAPVERHHREWALRAMGESPDPAVRIHGDEPLDEKDLKEAYYWLDAGEFPKEALEDANDDDLEVIKLVVTISQAFANFEFELRTETDAALKECKEHAKTLDTNWHMFNQMSLGAIRVALDLDEKASVHDILEKIARLKNAASY